MTFCVPGQIYSSNVMHKVLKNNRWYSFINELKYLVQEYNLLLINISQILLLNLEIVIFHILHQTVNTIIRVSLTF